MLSNLLPVVAALLGLVSATAHERAYFYVGGGYEVTSGGENIFTNQTYVEKLTPAGGASKEHPIVFIHGNGQTGTVCQLPSLPLPIAIYGDHISLKIRDQKWDQRKNFFQRN